MIFDLFFNHVNIFIIILYLSILYFYDFKDNIGYLLLITISVVFVIIKISNGKKDNIIETIDNMEDIEDIIEELEEERELTTTSNDPKIIELTNRIKALEEMISLKQWSSAQSYEISDLRKKLTSLTNDPSKDNDNDNDKEIEDVEHITNLSPDPIFIEKENEEENKQKLKEITHMGRYDGLCLETMEKKSNYSLADDKDITISMGSQIPINIEKTENEYLQGPSIDGVGGNIKRLSFFSNNKSSVSCCEDSPFFTSTGCVCLTKGQEDFINKRGDNHILN